MKPSKKQTALSGFLLFMLILGAYVVGFVGWGSPKQSASTFTNACDGVFRSQYGRCATGTDSCSIATGATSCFKTETFVTAFTNTPLVGYPITNTGARTANLNNSQIGTFFATGNTLTGETWPNMPAAQTEIFGDVAGDHWMHMDGTGFSKLNFIVNCLVGSISATATLQLQWSPDTGATWNNIGNAVNIQAGNCPNGDGSTGTGASGYATMPIGIQCYLCNGSVPIVYRIVGQNGNGLGDNPSFQSARIEMTGFKTVTNIIFFQVGNPSTTFVTITANVQFPVLTAYSVSWSWRADSLSG